MDNNVLKSFEVKTKLNGDIWTSGGTLNPEIRLRLLEIADYFLDYIKLPSIDVDDIIFTGSLANYNWSEYSDVDLHIVLDKDDIGDNDDLINEYLMVKKWAFSKEHDITVKGFEVELYVQDIKERHDSSGIYSVLYNHWITKPKLDTFDINIGSVKSKIKKMVGHLDSMFDELSRIEDEDDDEKRRDMAMDLFTRLTTFKDKLKKYRSCGLERAGESSDENVVYKYMRRAGVITKLSEARLRLRDIMLTLDEQQ